MAEEESGWAFLQDFGKQAAEAGVGILTALGNEAVGLPTTTAGQVPNSPASPAGQVAPVYVVDARNDLDRPAGSVDVLGVPVDKTALYVTGGLVALILVVVVVRG